jgi:hypothetical protein
MKSVSRLLLLLCGRKNVKRRSPILVKNSRIPKLLSIFIQIYAITLFPFIFFRDEGTPTTENHERIHIAQQRELLVVFFYLLYVFDWFIGLIKYRSLNAAYMRIRFEQEAYAFEHETYYTLNRKFWAWRKYKV